MNLETAQRTTEVNTLSEQVSWWERLPSPRTFFNRQWWWTTLLVIAAMAVMARLGVWQLDRREQRIASNTTLMQQLAQPPLTLNEAALPADLAQLKDRQATVRGTYDLERQVALTQQHWFDLPGFHLITPLRMEGRAEAVLVDRGWIPAEELPQENWSRYDVQEPVAVTGYIQLSQTLPGKTDAMNTEPQREWYRVDVAAIAAQLPYEVLPIYLKEGPPPGGSGANDAPPYRSELAPDLSEGPHLGYAIQWFIFAAILGVGYIGYVSKSKRTE